MKHRTFSLNLSSAVVMNMDHWNSLPETVKDVMESIKQEQADWTGTYMDSHVNDSMAWSKAEHNVEVITLSDEQRQEWNGKLDFLVQQWITTANEAGLPADAIINDIKTFTSQYAGR